MGTVIELSELAGNHFELERIIELNKQYRSILQKLRQRNEEWMLTASGCCGRLSDASHLGEQKHLLLGE
jgi:hypothetical protein